MSASVDSIVRAEASRRALHRRERRGRGREGSTYDSPNIERLTLRTEEILDNVVHRISDRLDELADLVSISIAIANFRRSFRRAKRVRLSSRGVGDRERSDDPILEVGLNVGVEHDRCNRKTIRRSVVSVEVGERFGFVWNSEIDGGDHIVPRTSVGSGSEVELIMEEGNDRGCFTANRKRGIVSDATLWDFAIRHRH